jgi:carbamoyl-phosphate synthase large subunit
MEIVYSMDEFEEFFKQVAVLSPEHPILLDKFLESAIEVDVDALSDGTDTYVGGVMEHIEEAGIHSGDSACVLPPHTIPAHLVAEIERQTEALARELNVVGLMNIQYAIYQDTVYILEANPRASRTVPLVSKVCNIPMARIATQIMLGKKLKDLKLERKPIPHFGVKEAVFPFNMFPEVDPLLGPEMRSTGEVLGMADNFGLAFYKAEEAAGPRLPSQGTVLITVATPDQPRVLDAARRFADLGFTLKATKGTQQYLAEQGVQAEPILKMHEGRPNIADEIKSGTIHLVVNTPIGKASVEDDSYIRKAAIKHKVPYITTTIAASAAAKGIAARAKGEGPVKSLQEYHKDLG